MNRRTRSMVSLAAALALAFASAPAALAADYSLANGAVTFSAPDAWPMLMEKQEGQRQFVALQIREPGSSDSLARITVTVQQVNGVQGFQKFLDDDTARARKLPGYVPENSPGASSNLRYTASENGRKNTYAEHYLYRSNLGIQVRCIRPVDSPADWASTFDAGCQSIISAVEH